MGFRWKFSYFWPPCFGSLHRYKVSLPGITQYLCVSGLWFFLGNMIKKNKRPCSPVNNYVYHWCFYNPASYHLLLLCRFCVFRAVDTGKCGGLCKWNKPCPSNIWLCTDVWRVVSRLLLEAYDSTVFDRGRPEEAWPICGSHGWSWRTGSPQESCNSKTTGYWSKASAQYEMIAAANSWSRVFKQIVVVV